MILVHVSQLESLFAISFIIFPNFANFSTQRIFGAVTSSSMDAFVCTYKTALYPKRSMSSCHLVWVQCDLRYLPVRPVRLGTVHGS